MKVSFVSYDGKYTCLCGGKLTVKIGNNKYTLPSHAFGSGGSVSFDKDWSETVEEGEWYWDDSILKSCDPVVIKHKNQILEVMNSNVDHGCCGGCV